MSEDRRTPQPQRRASGGGFGLPHPKAAEPPTPGLAARLAAEQAIAEALGQGRALDEFFSPQSIAPRLDGLDARDRALARSIAPVALRRLGTIR